MAIPVPNNLTGAGSLPVNPLGPFIKNLSHLGARVQQGSQVLFVAKGSVLGYAQRLTPNESYGTSNFYGVGAFGPQDIQPLQFSGSVTISGGRLYLGGWAGAKTTKERLFYHGTDMILSGDLDIMVWNAVTQAPDIILLGCVASSYSPTWQNNAYTLQTATFNYKDSMDLGAGAVATKASSVIRPTAGGGGPVPSANAG